MPGLFDGTPLERPVTCEVCGKPRDECTCPRDAAGDVCRPADQPARVRQERRRKGKVVTTVAGLDPVASDLPEVLRMLKKACSAGGTVTDGVIEVQGEHAERVTTLLAEQGYPVRNDS